jgi:hypothetical protein
MMLGDKMKIQKILLTIIVILFVLMSYVLFVPRHSSNGYYSGVDYINQDFNTVRKVLVLNDCIEEIISQQHGELLNNEWEKFNITINKILGLKWEFDGVANLTVKFKDPHAGNLILFLKQEIYIRNNLIENKIYLEKPVGALEQYNVHMRLTPDESGSKTKIEMTVSLQYSRNLPVTHIKYMDKKVQNAADHNYNNGIEAIKMIVEKNKNRLFSIPIRPSRPIIKNPTKN